MAENTVKEKDTAKAVKKPAASASEKKPAAPKAAAPKKTSSAVKKAVDTAADVTPKAPKKTEKASKSLKITLTKSLTGRNEKHIATAKSLKLKKIGDTTLQPDNPQTRGKIAQISYMVTVTD